MAPPAAGRKGPKELTGIVDLTRRNGRPKARLLDLVPGRSGKAYADWLTGRGEPFTAGVEVATLDPFRGYSNAIRDELEDATAVLDAFHVVKLGVTAMEETRRRVQQEQLGHRGRKNDPLYKIRNVLRSGVQRLTERQIERLETGLEAGDPDYEVTVAWRCYQQLRSAYHTKDLAEGRQIAIKIVDRFHTCPIPEIARLGRTLRAGSSSSWPTSPPAARTTAEPKRSVSVVPAGLGLAGQDGPGRVARCVTHEAIDPFGGVLPLNCPH